MKFIAIPLHPIEPHSHIPFPAINFPQSQTEFTFVVVCIISHKKNSPWKSEVKPLTVWSSSRLCLLFLLFAPDVIPAASCSLLLSSLLQRYYMCCNYRLCMCSSKRDHTGTLLWIMGGTTSSEWSKQGVNFFTLVSRAKTMGIEEGSRVKCVGI